MSSVKKMVPRARIERATNCLKGSCSILWATGTTLYKIAYSGFLNLNLCVGATAMTRSRISSNNALKISGLRRFIALFNSRRVTARRLLMFYADFIFESKAFQRTKFLRITRRMISLKGLSLFQKSSAVIAVGQWIGPLSWAATFISMAVPPVCRIIRVRS